MKKVDGNSTLLSVSVQDILRKSQSKFSCGNATQQCDNFGMFILSFKTSTDISEPGSGSFFTQSSTELVRLVKVTLMNVS